MTLFDVAILGTIQGLTEFLPVSSKGHLLAARYLFGIDDTGGLAFDAFLHLGTLVAVIVYYWPVWVGMLRAVFRNDAAGSDKRELFAKLCIATIPAATLGFVFEDWLVGYLRNPHLLVAGLLFTAGILAFFDHYARKQAAIARAGYKDALLIGFAQVLALLPGVSRSGMTMAAGRARGLSREQAATFSFLMSAPIVAGTGLHSLSSLLHLASLPPAYLLTGFITSCVCGLFAIDVLLRIVKRTSYTPFIIYLLVMATVITYVIR